jgi:hypothetical protein
MEKSKAIVIIALAVVACAGIVGAYMLLGPETGSPTINESQAQEIILNNSDAAAYYSSHFKVEEWRVTTTSLVESAPNSTVLDEEGIWKIDIMERSCACSGIKDLYVIEGYVSSSTGELLEVSTKSVLESQYEKKTCASTSCH